MFKDHSYVFVYSEAQHTLTQFWCEIYLRQRVSSSGLLISFFGGRHARSQLHIYPTMTAYFSCCIDLMWSVIGASKNVLDAWEALLNNHLNRIYLIYWSHNGNKERRCYWHSSFNSNSLNSTQVAEFLYAPGLQGGLCRSSHLVV